MGVSADLSGALDLENTTPIQRVQLDALVVLQIIKHSDESYPDEVTGQLLGLDVGDVLEVTHCFPFPIASGDDREDDRAQHQLDMMEYLRDVNVDNNTVGWYQSAPLGAFLTGTFVKTQMDYQKSLKNKSIVIVHDPAHTRLGNVGLHAFRLSQCFMDLYAGNMFTTADLQKAKLTRADMLEEIPITIHNSHLLNACLASLSDTAATGTSEHGSALPTSLGESLFSRTQEMDVERLSREQSQLLVLTSDDVFEAHLQAIADKVDEHISDQNNHQYWQRSMAREQTKINQYLSKKRADNAAREAAGRPPLPEESEADLAAMFRLPTEPSRFDSLLTTEQIHRFTKQVGQLTGPATTKMFIVGNFTKATLSL